MFCLILIIILDLKNIEFKVPKTLSGHHKNIEDWKLNKKKQKTKENRPDLWLNYKKNELGK